MERIVRICAQGAAHGVWNEMARVVVGGRDEMWEWKEESLVISVTVDMIVVLEVKGEMWCGEGVCGQHFVPVGSDVCCA